MKKGMTERLMKSSECSVTKEGDEKPQESDREKCQLKNIWLKDYLLVRVDYDSFVNPLQN